MPKPLFPRGFVSNYTNDVVGSDIYERRDGDEEVVRLYTDHIRKHENTQTWEFRKQVIDCAVRMFGEFPRWVLIQKLNKHLHGTNYDFLLDTLQYLIAGGKRSASVATWMEIMEVKPLADDKRIGKEDEIMNIFIGPYAPKTPDIISTWCGKENGFEDMLCTLYCMFGD